MHESGAYEIKLELFNYATNEYDSQSVSTYTLNTYFKTRFQQGNNTSAQYVGSTGQVKSRVSVRRLIGTSSGSWSFDLEQFHWQKKPI
jgi:hypothetical protein